MNVISVAQARTKFCADPHGVIRIDGEPLDLLLASLTRINSLIGLVPTWLGWMNEAGEQAEVDARSSLGGSFPRILPLLVCPDDLDFACTLVVAEFVVTGDLVSWPRMGLDVSNGTGASTRADTVDWFAEVPSFQFTLDNFSACLREFSKIRTQED